MYLSSLPCSTPAVTGLDPGKIMIVMGQWLPSLAAAQNHLRNFFKFMDAWVPLLGILILLVWYGAQKLFLFLSSCPGDLYTWEQLSPKGAGSGGEGKQLNLSWSPGCTLDL